MNQPNFFIIGAPKCGTTSLANWLSQHPQVFMSPVKEPHFYNIDMSQRFYTDKSKYLRLFDGVSEKNKMIGEASVFYLYSSKAVELIEADNPTAKYIVCLRNPTEMSWSYHNQIKFSQLEFHSDFTVAWENGTSASQSMQLPRRCKFPELLDYQNVCSLGSQVQRLLSKVPMERVHFAFLDDMIKDPTTTWTKILNFLEIDPSVQPNLKPENSAKTYKNKFLRSSIIFLTRLKRKLHLEQYGLGIATWLSKKNNQPISKTQRPSTYLESVVSPAFLHEIELLEKLTKRNLQAWKK